MLTLRMRGAKSIHDIWGHTTRREQTATQMRWRHPPVESKPAFSAMRRGMTSSAEAYAEMTVCTLEVTLLACSANEAQHKPADATTCRLSKCAPRRCRDRHISMAPPPATTALFCKNAKQSDHASRAPNDGTDHDRALDDHERVVQRAL